jgi:PAS domain S-box-containing protein
MLSFNLRVKVPVNRVVLIAISLSVASLLAVSLRPVLHNQAQLLPFTLAVLLSSYYGGLWPGLVSTVLGFLLADYFFIEPMHQVLSVYPGDYALLGVFLLFGTSISILSHLRLRLSSALAEANQRLTLTVQELAQSNESLRRFDQAQKSGDFARAVVATIHEALAVIDSNCRVLTVNRTFCDLFRTPASEIENRSLFGVGAGQLSAPGLQELLLRAISKGTQISEFAVDQEFPKVGLRRLVLTARPIPESSTILIVLEDFTERRQAQEEVEKSQMTIRALLESTTQSVIAVDSRGTIVIVNGCTEKMFGYTRDELLGQQVEILVPDAVRSRHTAHTRQYQLHSQSRPMGLGLVLEGRRKNGELFPVEIGLSTVETVGGRLTAAFINDITQRRHLEQAAFLHAEEVRALAASLMTAQEEERRRVSRELHDQICQQLAALAFDIGGLVAAPPRLEEVQVQLKALQSRVIKASEETRHIAYELHPSVLDDLGLLPSLRALCKEFSERNAKVELNFTGSTLTNSVPRRIATCMYRVAQEGLQNVAKHANAKRVSVGLSLKAGLLALTIVDDGEGFDYVATKGRRGLGLISMEERAQLVQGKLTIHARPGRGTRIALEVRLPPETV